MNNIIAKDIKFTIAYNNYNFSNVEVYYGDKPIIKVAVHDDSITEFKAVCYALQAEILKEIVNNPKV